VPDLDALSYLCAACRQPSTTSLCAFCALRMRYYLALRCFRWRFQETPFSGRRGKPLETWADWFKARTGESVYAFGIRAKKTGLRAKIRAFELAVFGRTSAKGGPGG